MRQDSSNISPSPHDFRHVRALQSPFACRTLNNNVPEENTNAIPSYGFDPTEVAVPWKILSNHGIEVVFTTPCGDKACADRIMLTGENLGVWKSLLKARKDAVTSHDAMGHDTSFCNPLRYADARETLTVFPLRWPRCCSPVSH